MNRWKHISQAYKKESARKGDESPATPHKESIPVLPPGLLKTESGKENKQKGYVKAAKFFLLLGKEEASKVFSHLGEEEIEGIALEIAKIKQIPPEEAKELLSEFGIMRNSLAGYTGGVSTAKSILEKAFGKEKGGEILKKVVPHGGERPFAFFDDLEVHQIHLLLKEEPAHVISMVLVYLQPGVASKILDQLQPEKAGEVVRRIAVMEKIHPQVLAAVQDTLRERMKRQGKIVTEEVDGKNALARILRYSDSFTESAILDDLGKVDPDLSEEVRERLYTIDMVLNIDDKQFQQVLRDFSDSELAIIIKGQNESVRNKFFENLSERRRLLVSEEGVHLGYMRKSEVGKAVKEFMEYLRGKEEDGSLVIYRENDYVS